MSAASISPNSHAALSSTAGSAHTRLRGPTSRDARSPTAKARRYGGIGCGIAQRSVAVSPSTSRATKAAAISARRAAGTVSSASKVTRTRGVS